jgi:hypothetical protein
VRCPPPCKGEVLGVLLSEGMSAGEAVRLLNHPFSSEGRGLIAGEANYVVASYYEWQLTLLYNHGRLVGFTSQGGRKVFPSEGVPLRAGRVPENPTAGAERVVGGIQ